VCVQESIESAHPNVIYTSNFLFLFVSGLCWCGLRSIHSRSDWAVTTFPNHAMLLFHVASSGLSVDSEITILDEPVLGGLLIDLIYRLALGQVIRCFVQDAIFEALTQDCQDFVLHHAISTPLLVSFKHAHMIVRVALVNAGHTVELLVIPGITFPIWFHNRFYKEEKLRNDNMIQNNIKSRCLPMLCKLNAQSEPRMHIKTQQSLNLS